MRFVTDQFRAFGHILSCYWSVQTSWAHSVWQPHVATTVRQLSEVTNWRKRGIIITGGNSYRYNFCCNKRFVATNTFVATNCFHDKYLSWQTILLWQKFCHDKHTFVTTKDTFCPPALQDKQVTNMCLSQEKLYLWQLPPMIENRQPLIWCTPFQA